MCRNACSDLYTSTYTQGLRLCSKNDYWFCLPLYEYIIRTMSTKHKAPAAQSFTVQHVLYVQPTLLNNTISMSWFSDAETKEYGFRECMIAITHSDSLYQAYSQRNEGHSVCYPAHFHPPPSDFEPLCMLTLHLQVPSY